MTIPSNQEFLFWLTQKFQENPKLKNRYSFLATVWQRARQVDRMVKDAPALPRRDNTRFPKPQS